jgi:hypothetical protein
MRFDQFSDSDRRLAEVEAGTVQTAFHLQKVIFADENAVTTDKVVVPSTQPAGVDSLGEEPLLTELASRGLEDLLDRAFELDHIPADQQAAIRSLAARQGGGIFASGGNARSVIYVCDGSASMILGGWDDLLKRELKGAVAHLAPNQSFNALFFQETENGGYFRASGPELQMASPQNISSTLSFLDQFEFRDGTNPLAAMADAFREKPELVYLVTDGEFDKPDSSVVLGKIDAMNMDKKVRVNTVLLLRSKAKTDENDSFEAILAKIALDNGGAFTKFYADDW